VICKLVIAFRRVGYWRSEEQSAARLATLWFQVPVSSQKEERAPNKGTSKLLYWDQKGTRGLRPWKRNDNDDDDDDDKRNKLIIVRSNIEQLQS
jgi:hypothetical protein